MEDDDPLFGYGPLMFDDLHILQRDIFVHLFEYFNKLNLSHLNDV